MEKKDNFTKLLQEKQIKKKLIILVPVAQSCNPDIGGQGHRDAHGLSAKDPPPRLWICVHTTVCLMMLTNCTDPGPGALTCLYGDNSTYEHE